MSLGILAGMATVSIGGMFLSKLVGKMGKVDDAQMIDTASTSILIVTTVGIVVKALGTISKLGK